ncbi:MAG: prepilin peptidase [Candidatus Dojkabacteria bacterium]|nr:prepilin peptidase [Candidatus Dojkabacteria bacterium]MDQ7020459.1 prepilin peptidase [Candidatus Dojkabacteria bacterium]
MPILFTLIIVYFANFLSKKFYFTCTDINLISRFKSLDKNDLLKLKLYLIPFSSIIFKKHLLVKEGKILFVSELLSIFTAFILSLSFINIYIQNTEVQLWEILLHFSFYFGVYILILYLAVYDIINFAVPVAVIKKGLFVIVLISLFITIADFFSYRTTSEYIFELINIGNLSSLIGAFFLVALTWSVVKLTSEEGLGEGDIDVNMIIGLSIGWPLVVPFLLSTLILGSIVALAFSYYLKKFRGVLIPFVPLILIGFTVALGFGQNINDIIFINY